MKQLLKFITIAIAPLTLCSCGNEANTSSIGKYVYIDDAFVLHIDSQCEKLLNGKDNGGHKIHGKHLVDISEFVISDSTYFRVCARCVDDSIYEQLLRISNKNEIYEFERKNIYNRLVNANYAMEPYSIFKKNIANPIKRKMLYNAVCDEGWAVGNYDEFSTSLGFKNNTANNNDKHKTAKHVGW